MYVHVYIYIYILGSSARFARADAYGIRLWDYITGFSHAIILRDNIKELYYGTMLRDCITGL